MLKRRINRLAALFEIADAEFLNVRNEIKIHEEKAQEKVAALSLLSPEQEDYELDIFQFLIILEHSFSSYNFIKVRADDFLNEIKKYAPNLSLSRFSKILNAYLEIAHIYREYQQLQFSKSLNPYTIIRHVLYLSDKETFEPMIFDIQRKKFDEWLNNNYVDA
jgi:hypothetical protein